MSWSTYDWNGSRTRSDLRQNATVTLVIGLLFFGAIVAFAIAGLVYSVTRPINVAANDPGLHWSRCFIWLWLLFLSGRITIGIVRELRWRWRQRAQKRST